GRSVRCEGSGLNVATGGGIGGGRGGGYGRWSRVMAGGGGGPTSRGVLEMGGGGGWGVRRGATRAVRRPPPKLWREGKAEPAFRFYLLYDKIHREDILRHAYALTRFNAGAAGVDGMSFAAIEASGLKEWLAGLREELISKTYRPDPVRRVMISKPGGGER